MKTILIVEDNDLIRESLDLLFSREGYKVIQWPCSTGAEKLIKRVHPDFVLTDHNLGDHEEAGFSLAVRLKGQGIKVALMSADPFIGEAAAEEDLAFIKKPFSAEPLLKIVSEAAHA